MNKGITIVLTVLFFILTLALILFPKKSLLVQHSPQATVNPASMKDEFNPEEQTAIYDNKQMAIPSGVMALVDSYTAPELASANANVLGESTGGKRIEVDLTNQRLTAYEGDKQVYSFLISSGKWGRTPTGTFDIWIKMRSTKMSGGSKQLGTYYYLPNVPYTMYFYNSEIPQWKGFGIHGAYWHTNFGHPMSHGCINMKPEEAGLVFEWAQPSTNGKHTMYASSENPGTKVVIYGTAPNS
jgi:lipoprotein-anchoring transpeptidase ErfK/SrfK